MNKPATRPAPVVNEADDLGFGEPAKKPSLKELLFRPATAAALVIGIAIAAFVVYLEVSESTTSLPMPVVSYTLLPNEGRTSGIPIAIKLNQVTLFVIDDPLSGGEGAARAKALVERLQNMVSDLRENPGKAVTFVTDTGLPSLVLQNPDGSNRRSLVQLTLGDITLAGGGDPKRVVRVWAERLTDALKLLAFGEAPEFSTGTAFGDALTAMYVLAREASPGAVTGASLDAAFEKLTDGQRLALETLPQLAPEQTAASRG